MQKVQDKLDFPIDMPSDKQLAMANENIQKNTVVDSVPKQYKPEAVSQCRIKKKKKQKRKAQRQARCLSRV